MPRRLGEELSEVKIRDVLSDSDVVLFYRLPTTKMRLGYENAKAVRKNGKVVNRLPEARQEYGLKILAGIGEGDFEHKVDGEWKPLSSDPKSPDYDPDWKGILAKLAGDMVELLAIQVFDVSAVIQPKAEPDADEDADEDEGGEATEADEASGDNEDPGKNS